MTLYMISIEKNPDKWLRFRRALDRCPRCGSLSIIRDAQSGEFLCSSCGLVVKEKMEDTGPEWVVSSSEEGKNRSRVGSPTSIADHDMGLATTIGRLNSDSSGRSLSSSMRSTVDRMRIWDRRTQLHQNVDKNLKTAFSEMRLFADRLSLSNEVLEAAAYVYRKALERDLIRGRSIAAMSAAALYAACRDGQVPRSLREVAVASNVPKKDLARSYRLLIKEMDIRMPVPDPVKSIAKIASKAGMDERTKRRALEILTKAKQHGVVAGKDPVGLAASALYVASTLEGGTRTQKHAAEAAGVTEVTIRNRYKDLRRSLAI